MTQVTAPVAQPRSLPGVTTEFASPRQVAEKTEFAVDFLVRVEV